MIEGGTGLAVMGSIRGRPVDVVARILWADTTSWLPGPSAFSTEAFVKAAMARTAAEAYTWTVTDTALLPSITTVRISSLTNTCGE